MQERMFIYKEECKFLLQGEGEKDIWKAYVRRGMNSEKGQMKLRLLVGAARWSDAGDCRRSCRRLEEPEGTENAFLQEEFKAERARLEGRLAEIWREKKRMEHCLQDWRERAGIHPTAV